VWNRFQFRPWQKLWQHPLQGFVYAGRNFDEQGQRTSLAPPDQRNRAPVPRQRAQSLPDGSRREC
jgi:hypothetical protein